MARKNGRPAIGLPVGRQLPEHPDFLRIRQTYPNAIVAAGGLPVLVPPMDDPEALRQLVSKLDGVIFPGGQDVGPQWYGEPAHPTTRVDDLLDALEIGLARQVLSEDLPTLGICRGQQLLNVALGGTLVQDLAVEQIRHRQQGSRSELTHAISLAPGSRLAEILGVTTLEVNSLHHQAVQRLGRGLAAVAWAPDGVVEGTESSEHSWLLTVQFHPEDLVGFHEPSQRLFQAFVDVCQKRAAKRAD